MVRSVTSFIGGIVADIVQRSGVSVIDIINSSRVFVQIQTGVEIIICTEWAGNFVFTDFKVDILPLGKICRD